MLNVEEALRYLGVRGPVPDGLRGQAEDVAAMFPKAEIIKDICGIERVVVVRA